MDRRAALDFLETLLKGQTEPQTDDIAGPGSVLSPPIADVINRRIDPGFVAAIWPQDDIDLAVLARPPFTTLFATAASKGGEMRLVLSPQMRDQLDEAARAGLRNASHRHGFTIWSGLAKQGANGAPLIATLGGPDGSVGFYSRDSGVGIVGPAWGAGELHPVIQVPLSSEPAVFRVADEFFERVIGPGDRVTIIDSDPARPVRLFGTGLVSRLLKPSLEEAGLWKPGQLVSLSYSDRYLKAPLPALLLIRVAAALRDGLASKGAAIPLSINTNSLRDDRYGGASYKLWDNWRDERDRADTIRALAELFGFNCSYESGSAQHGRKMLIRYDDGSQALVLFDQGFGYWQANGGDQHNFRATPNQQAKALIETSAFVAGRGESYVALTAK